MENFLLFTEIPTEKMLQMQGWVEKNLNPGGWLQVGWLIDPRSLLGGAFTSPRA